MSNEIARMMRALYPFREDPPVTQVSHPSILHEGDQTDRDDELLLLPLYTIVRTPDPQPGQLIAVAVRVTETTWQLSGHLNSYTSDRLLRRHPTWQVVLRGPE